MIPLAPKSRRSLLAALCSLGGVASAAGNEIVVTAESFAGAVAAAAPGQPLVLADGVYRDVQFGFAAQGAPGNPITLRAQTPGKVILIGRAELTVSGETALKLTWGGQAGAEAST